MNTRSLRTLVIFGVLLVLSSAWAQESNKEALYSYAVPFYCGSSDESLQEGLVSGRHATAINVHNPSVHFKVVFNKAVSRALPFQRSDTISSAEQHILAKNEAIEVECNEIRMKLPHSMTAQFSNRLSDHHIKKSTKRGCGVYLKATQWRSFNHRYGSHYTTITATRS